jgi:hypothetical protein
MPYKRKSTPHRKKYQRFRISESRRKSKLKAIEYKGGKCQKCGYNKCPNALVFHHLDPSKKDFGISSGGKIKNFEKIKAELDKCVLLCQNCHSEVHYEEFQLNRLKILKELEEGKRKNTPQKVIKKCSFCKVELTISKSKDRKDNFCTRKCKVQFDNRFWPPDSDLLKMHKSLSAKEIAEKLSKNLKTVYKRLLKLKKRSKIIHV